jgi:hypothetical protein
MADDEMNKIDLHHQNTQTIFPEEVLEHYQQKWQKAAGEKELLADVYDDGNPMV